MEFKGLDKKLKTCKCIYHINYMYIDYLIKNGIVYTEVNNKKVYYNDINIIIDNFFKQIIKKILIDNSIEYLKKNISNKKIKIKDNSIINNNNNNNNLCHKLSIKLGGKSKKKETDKDICIKHNNLVLLSLTNKNIHLLNIHTFLFYLNAYYVPIFLNNTNENNILYKEKKDSKRLIDVTDHNYLISLSNDNANMIEEYYKNYLIEKSIKRSCSKCDSMLFKVKYEDILHQFNFECEICKNIYVIDRNNF